VSSSASVEISLLDTIITFHTLIHNSVETNDLKFQSTWTNFTQNSDILRARKGGDTIAESCFPDQFVSNITASVSSFYFSAQVTSQGKGIEFQVGILGNADEYVLFFEYEQMDFLTFDQPFAFSYQITSLNERTNDYFFNTTRLLEQSTCQQPGEYFHYHQFSKKPSGRVVTPVTHQIARPWTPLPNPFLHYDIPHSPDQRSRPDQAEVVTLDGNSMTVRNIYFYVSKSLK